jgi:hypothetical protein
VAAQVLGPRGQFIKIISKVENQEGIQNFDEILAKTDSVMVARGDLGMEVRAGSRHRQGCAPDRAGSCDVPGALEPARPLGQAL